MSFSKFSIKDYALIRRKWLALEEMARGRCHSEEELEVVWKAFDFANRAHRHVRRRSGEPYIIHPIEVAQIVIGEIGLGYKSISAALLHDVVEDTAYTIEDIRTQFGDKIATLVDGLTKIKTVLDNQDRQGNADIESNQAENLKRILLTLNDDVRVALIKLADRLHNCRTIEFMPEHKRDKILSETMFIFIPLAHRLGLYGIKTEMENIWLRYKEPDAYNEISERISRNVALRDREIDSFIAPIEGALKRADLEFEIRKRIKSPYSIWFKMRSKKVPFEEIYDLYAVRIIYDPGEVSPDKERALAFNIYSILGSLYGQRQDRYRDWISSPKSNGYEALHCTLMSHSGFWVEVQIRSRRMNDIAERGIAAHWAYKNNGYISENDSAMDSWLAKVQEILQSKDANTMELLDIIHKDLVTTDIVVFTPKGQQKSIQAGSTALDFAYLIHTHIGNRAIAAKVNMKLVPLSHVLKTGDQVEIITAESGRPKIEWLHFLQTRHARNVVMDYFRSDRDNISKRGSNIYNSLLNAAGIAPGYDVLRKFLEYAQLNDQTELFFRIGLGIIDQKDFGNVLRSMDVNTMQNGKYVLADCCKPIPGEPMIGFLGDDGIIIAHKKSCPVAENLASKHGNRLVAVPDMIITEREFPARVSLRGIDRVGLLNTITQTISLNMGLNIQEIHLGGQDGVFEGFIQLLVRDKKGLESMISALRKIDGITEIVRTDI